MKQASKMIRGQKYAGLYFGASFVLIFMAFFLCISFSAEGYVLSVGHLPPLRNGHTVLFITDLSGTGPAVKISFYDELGHEISASPVHKLLPPDGKVQINVENYLRTAGSIALEASSDQIIAEYWQISENGAIFALPLQPPGLEGRFFVNAFRFPSCEHNYLVLSDPVSSGPLVQMEFYNRAGELIKIASKLIRPYGMLAFEVSEYASWNTLGKVSVRGFGGSIGLHYRILCGKDAVAAIPARLPAKELFIDEFSVGRGISGNLILADTSAEGPATKIRFRNSDGIILYEIEKLLPPNGTLLIEPADYLDGVHRGTIGISSESEIIADYWEKKPKGILNTPAIDKTGSILFVSHFSPFDGVENLLSLLNVGQEKVKAEVQFYSDNGQRLHTREFSLEPYKRVDELVGNYFDGASLGTIMIKSSNASLAVTYHVFDPHSQNCLGKVKAQVIR